MDQPTMDATKIFKDESAKGIDSAYNACMYGRECRSNKAEVGQYKAHVAVLKTAVRNYEQQVFEDWLLHTAPSGNVEQVQRQWEESSGHNDFISDFGEALASTPSDSYEELKKLRDKANPDFREMREMLRAMQAGELTVSRGIEILEMWHAGNWRDDMLPPVRQDLIEEDSMPVEIIDRLTAERDALKKRWDTVVSMAQPGAIHFGSVLNNRLLAGHRDKKRMLASILFSGNSASEFGVNGFEAAIDAANQSERE